MCDCTVVQPACLASCDCTVVQSACMGQLTSTTESLSGVGGWWWWVDHRVRMWSNLKLCWIELMVEFGFWQLRHIHYRCFYTCGQVCWSAKCFWRCVEQNFTRAKCFIKGIYRKYKGFLRAKQFLVKLLILLSDLFRSFIRLLHLYCSFQYPIWVSIKTGTENRNCFVLQNPSYF